MRSARNDPEGHSGLPRQPAHEMAVPRFLVLLAEAHGQAGKTDKGLGVLAEALVDSAARSAIAMRRPRNFTASGESLLLAVSAEHQDEAEASLRRALDIARRQQAKSPELRATMSLARLLEKRGDRKEARAMLAAIYGWFTEGFDTADLKEAKTLLEQLSGKAT